MQASGQQQVKVEETLNLELCLLLSVYVVCLTPEMGYG